METQPIIQAPSGREQTSPVFRLATCDDLLRLGNARPELLLPEPHCWGLKQMGILFCLDSMARLGAQRVLEVGIGKRTHFDEWVGRSRESWAADKSGFYEGDSFQAAHRKRKHTKLVETLMGEFSPELPPEHFDFVFSVSVLEHVPAGSIADACRDIARVLRPGGYTVHSLDVGAKRPARVAGAWLSAFAAAGFETSAMGPLRFRLASLRGPTLLEPLQILVASKRATTAADRLGFSPIRSQQGTVLILLKKTGQPRRVRRRAAWRGWLGR